MRSKDIFKRIHQLYYNTKNINFCNSFFLLRTLIEISSNIQVFQFIIESKL